MIIAFCILGVLLLCSVFLNVSLWCAINYLIDKDPKFTMDYYFDKEVEEKFPCSLLLSVKEGADFNGSVFDFSQYEETGVIGLTEFRKEITSGKTFEEEDGELKVAVLPNQIVCKMKDGSHQWDFRRLM